MFLLLLGTIFYVYLIIWLKVSIYAFMWNFFIYIELYVI